jgi:HEAT repeat protein
VQLTSRRRVVAAVVTATVAIALAAVATGRGCAPVDATPDGAVRAFVSAARSGDRKAAWALLGPATRARFEAAAEGATEKVGGVRRFAALDMLDLGASETTYVPSDYQVLSHGGGEASVEVLGPGGRRDVVRTVRVDGRWRIELDFAAPPAP